MIFSADVISVPNTAPSTLFFGLITGVILCLPIFRPTRKANESVSHEQANTIATRKHSSQRENPGFTSEKLFSRIKHEKAYGTATEAKNAITESVYRISLLKITASTKSTIA